MYDYSDRDNHTELNQFIESVGILFTALFTFECAVKVLAMGFIAHRHAYLRDGWNWIDFFVVVVGYATNSLLPHLATRRLIEVLPGVPNLRAIRTLRVLRPLRSSDPDQPLYAGLVQANTTGQFIDLQNSIPFL